MTSYTTDSDLHRYTTTKHRPQPISNTTTVVLNQTMLLQMTKTTCRKQCATPIIIFGIAVGAMMMTMTVLEKVPPRNDVPLVAVAAVEAWAFTTTNTSHRNRLTALKRERRNTYIRSQLLLWMAPPTSTSPSSLSSSQLSGTCNHPIQYQRTTNHTASIIQNNDEITETYTNPSLVPNRRSFLQNSVAMVSSMTLQRNTFVTLLSVPFVVTTTNVALAIEIDVTRTSLRPATEEQPQISFPNRIDLESLSSPTTLEGTSRRLVWVKVDVVINGVFEV